MGRFYPLYVRRSDGKLEVAGHHKRKEFNQPLPEQLDTKPDANGVSDYYREVSIEESKHLDWRRKLGGMLARDLGASDSGSLNRVRSVVGDLTDAPRDKGYILAAFPENYRLYEHVKKSTGEGNVPKTTKTHAGGGNERQDAYLYGHPMGRKKRYRSPADFYLHLYWLATDETGDPDNCPCKICTPEEIEEKQQVQVIIKREIKPEIKPDVTMRDAVKSETAPSRPTPAAAAAPPSVHKPKNEAVSTKTSSAQPQSRPLPRPTKQDQVMDLAYDMFVFRQGELVWFNRGQSWGLGVICRRWKGGDGQTKTCFYIVQPLSHPFQHPQAVTLSGEDKLRPWLAWSVPNYTCAGLNGLNAHYDTLDWHALFNNAYGQGDFEVDGSILAAKAIDPTYTTFDVTARTTDASGLEETHWAGIFLGAEKIWAGDVVRLHEGSGIDVLVVHDIVERSRRSAFNGQLIEWTLHIVGDEYTLAQVPQSSTQQLFPAGAELMNLPSRMVEDLRRRNMRTIPTKNFASLWKLRRAGSWRGLKEIKGRWYEATLLIPILNPAAVQTEFLRGDIHEAGLRMNNRFDSGKTRGQMLTDADKQDVRKSARRDAFLKAVPSSLKLVDGSEPPRPAEPAVQQQRAPGRLAIDPSLGTREGTNEMTAATADTSSAAVGGGGLDDFRDLTSMDGQGLGGLGHDYSSQTGRGPFY